MGAEVVPQPEGAHNRNLSTAVGGKGWFRSRAQRHGGCHRVDHRGHQDGRLQPGRKCGGGDVSIGMDARFVEFYKDGVYDYTKFIW